MKNFDSILSEKMQLLGEEESGKNLTPPFFYISKEEVEQLLSQKSDGYENFKSDILS